MSHEQSPAATAPHDKPAADKTVERERAMIVMAVMISVLLRWGVILSLTLIAIGLVISFVHHRDYFMTAESLRKLIRLDAPFPHSIRTTVVSVEQLRGQGLVVSGLLMLILTPILRVGLSIGLFLKQGDRAYTLMTATVLFVLVISFVLAKVE